MIDPTTLYGKTLMVFFWGGLSANIVSILWVIMHFSPIFLPWMVVVTNMIVVYFKNRLLPVKK